MTEAPMTKAPMTKAPMIGVALSGGGHRATIWAIGALLYLADVGKNADVGAISSVSGGSIANGVVAHEVEYRQVSGARFREAVRPLVRHCAYTGLFFWGPATNGYVISVLALFGIAGLALLAGVVVLAITGLGALSGTLLAVALATGAGGLALFGRRSLVVDRALARTHFRRCGQATPLAAVARRTDHIFCATELQSGDHLYLSPGFVYSYRFGMGTPADLPLSTAVQASACLPGAFAVRRLPTAPHRFARSPKVTVPSAPPDAMVLTDGGVYDNMGDQWLDGLSERLRGTPDLPVTTRVLDEIVVVNASAGSGWRSFPAARVPILGEIQALARIKDVMYAVSTGHRRGNLIRWFDDGAAHGGQVGALIHIGQPPYRVAAAYAGASDRWPDRALRANRVLAFLGDDPASRADWDTRARRSWTTPTVLRSLGPRRTADLLYHAYVLTACNLHVLLGYPLPGRLPSYLDFRALTEPPGGPAPAMSPGGPAPAVSPGGPVPAVSPGGPAPAAPAESTAAGRSEPPDRAGRVE